jgi:hypothetical protein
MKYFFTVFVLLQGIFINAQFSDSFADGDFTSNPSWSGSSADFIVNASGELQINNTMAATSYLSTPHGLSSMNNIEWHLKVRQTFAPSSSNFGRIYLTSTSADLTTNPDGFYLQLGESGTTDAVRLFKSVGGVSTPICAGTDGQIAASFAVGIKVTRDAVGLWQLYLDLTGGTSYGAPVSGTDATSILGTHFGVLGTYTLSNANKFYFDNIYNGPIIYDTTPPVLVSATATSANTFDVLFDEPVSTASAELVVNYAVSPFLTITTITIDPLNPALLHAALWTTTPFVNGTQYTLTSSNISDLSGNISEAQTAQFTYLVADVPLKGDVVINEFMCDPTPLVGLPEAEFVEIFNRSSKYFNLTGWKLGDASSDGTVQFGWLYPGEHKILCATANVDTFLITGVGVTSFPSLNNAGDDIVLKDPLGKIIDKISFTDAWYKDPIKEDGGWSIELINPNDPCSDEDNWKASISGSGGTPGAVNSVKDLTPDTSAPSIIALVPMAPNFLEVHFSEGMDSALVKNAQIITDPGLTVTNNFMLSAGASVTTLQFAENLIGSQVYMITLEFVGDCWMNQTNLSGTFALPETPLQGDIVINEILFDPFTGGYDWIEVYNNSQKLIDLQNWSLANYDNDTIDNQKFVSDHYFLKPGNYAVLGKDSSFVKQNYVASVPGTFVYLETPSYNNDSSTVYLLFNNQIMDVVSYNEDWHFPLIDNTDGLSLERIDPDGVSNDSSNWHSAAEAAGYATPGAVNSQYRPAVSNGEYSFTSNTISPDNDGHEDVLQINYQMNAAGLLGNFSIYDDRGRLIRSLFSNELLGSTGSFTWDGVTDQQVKASIGVYVAVFEVFSIDGGMMFSKTKAFVVAGKL